MRALHDRSLKRLDRRRDLGQRVQWQEGMQLRHRGWRSWLRLVGERNREPFRRNGFWSRAMDDATAPPSFFNFFYAARAARACLLLPTEHIPRAAGIFIAFLSARGRVFWHP